MQTEASAFLQSVCLINSHTLFHLHTLSHTHSHTIAACAVVQNVKAGDVLRGQLEATTRGFDGGESVAQSGFTASQLATQRVSAVTQHTTHHGHNALPSCRTRVEG